MIISYHPPIFNPLKRLTQNSWKEKILIRCLENLVAVYSPHTCWDAVEGGLNDWLISPFGLFLLLRTYGYLLSLYYMLVFRSSNIFIKYAIEKAGKSDLIFYFSWETGLPFMSRGAKIQHYNFLQVPK